MSYFILFSKINKLLHNEAPHLVGLVGANGSTIYVSLKNYIYYII